MEITYDRDMDGDLRMIFDNNKYRYCPRGTSDIDLEDAVLKLADKIKLERSASRFNNGNGPLTGSWDAGANVDEFKELINKFVGIIQKQTEIIDRCSHPIGVMMPND
jgi:hypothetical protein